MVLAIGYLVFPCSVRVSQVLLQREFLVRLRAPHRVDDDFAKPRQPLIAKLAHACFSRRADAYAELAPRNRQSGTSISSVSASRQGNKRLKNLLIFSCNSLTRSRGRFGEYYRKCRGRGMCHGEALKAVARKRVKVIYAIMRDRVPYAA